MLYPTGNYVRFFHAQLFPFLVEIQSRSTSNGGSTTGLNLPWTASKSRFGLIFHFKMSLNKLPTQTLEIMKFLLKRAEQEICMQIPIQKMRIAHAQPKFRDF